MQSDEITQLESIFGQLGEHSAVKYQNLLKGFDRLDRGLLVVSLIAFLVGGILAAVAKWSHNSSLTLQMIYFSQHCWLQS